MSLSENFKDHLTYVHEEKILINSARGTNELEPAWLIMKDQLISSTAGNNPNGDARPKSSPKLTDLSVHQR